MSRRLVGFEAVQVREEDRLLTGFLEVEEDGTVKFATTDSQPLQPNDQVKGRLGEFEEVEEPVPVEDDGPGN